MARSLVPAAQPPVGGTVVPDGAARAGGHRRDDRADRVPNHGDVDDDLDPRGAAASAADRGDLRAEDQGPVPATCRRVLRAAALDEGARSGGLARPALHDLALPG